MTTTVFTKWPSLPGSRHSSADEPADPTPAGLSSGRFTEAELTLMGEIISWWANRRALDDSSNPINSLLGGVDLRGTATTTGVPAVAVTWSAPLVPPTGCSLLIQAIGITPGAVYSVLALAHFQPSAGSYIGNASTIGRAPSTTIDITAALTGPPPGNTPVIQIGGISGQTINWTLNALVLEL